ncbi:lysophospholipid acyltransferase family protein [Acinetobacter towneri]|uniref:lysophospholipid acyltransferase family protein n=1 Tax=Acinetobacter towneri TaxID=202956 RepID=UPI001F602F58|nr:lysophospholipid acyltransferase family protein [Acinetobacter towneri]UNT65822.1 lysophospholipid acyltransferase family protein [Acinetobacter towneri]
MYFVFKFLSLLPLSLLQSLGTFIGWLLYLLPSSIRRITEINIRLVYPELSHFQQQALIKKSIKSQCCSFIECIKFWGKPATYSLSCIGEIHNAHHLTQAIQDQKGVIVVVPHLGNWELLNAWLCMQSHPVIMYKPNKNKAINRYILEARQKCNATLVPADETGVRAIFKHLKQGGLTVILPDHMPKPSGGIYAVFFQQNVMSGTIVSKLAHKTQAHVIGLSCLRNSTHHTFDIYCNVVPSSIFSKALEESVHCLNQHMENMIALAPEQYIWSYKRFRNCADHYNPYRDPPKPSAKAS